MIEGLTEGRVCHFVTADGQHLPAEIVKVRDCETGMVNVMVTADSPDRIEEFGGTHRLETGVLYSARLKQTGTWHWIERA